MKTRKWNALAFHFCVLYLDARKSCVAYPVYLTREMHEGRGTCTNRTMHAGVMI